MKLILFISRSKKEIQKSRRIFENVVNFAKYTEKIKLLQEVFDSRFSDFSEEYRMVAFINPFSLNITF